MFSFFRRANIFQKLFILIAAAAVLCYATASLSSFISPLYFWPFTMLALIFPFILTVYLLIIVLSIFIFRKISLYLFIVLFFGWKNISSVFAFHFNHTFQKEQRADIRLISWNVDEFINSEKKCDTTGSKAQQMFSFIKEINADILCFQDFVNFTGEAYRHNFEYLRDSLHFSYAYFPIDYTYDLAGTKRQYGVAIFSKFPIVATKQLEYWNEENEKFIYVDVLVKDKIVRLYSAHLKSMGIHTKYRTNNSEEDFLKSDTALFFHRSNLRTLKYFDRIHVDQAMCITRSLDTTSVPYVFCADLNSVPSSYTYQTLKKNLQDAFLENGFGVGKTYDSISPTLRIDVVLLNKQLRAVQQNTPHLKLSDHYPNVVDISLQ